MKKFELIKHSIVIKHEETTWETSGVREILKKLVVRGGLGVSWLRIGPRNQIL
jgi:hypothetical protein